MLSIGHRTFSQIPIANKYYKITNKTENHNGFQYKDGLNILKEAFNDDPMETCCSGGFYFTNATNIFKFLDYGCFLREVKLPKDDPKFRMIRDPSGDKWRCNRFILGERHNLRDIKTMRMLLDNGADIHINNDQALKWCLSNGYFEMAKFLLSRGADIDAVLIPISTINLAVLKFLTKNGADISAGDEFALMMSAENGRFQVVKFLVENGTDIHAIDDSALKLSARRGHLKIVKFLVEKGANVRAINDNDMAEIRYNQPDVYLFLQKYLDK